MSRVSSTKYLRDAKSIQDKLRLQRRTAKPPYHPDDALKLIEMGRLKRTLVKSKNGVFKQVKNVDEEALENANIRLHVDED